MDDVGDVGALAISCAGLFDRLSHLLPSSSDVFVKQMSPRAIDNEFARFKIWAGNLGALQRGRSSLDARTRDSLVLRSAVIRFLEQLKNSLIQSVEVVSGHRLPYEQELTPELEEDTLDHDEDVRSTSHISDSSDEREIEELTERLSEIRNVMGNLYRLSFKIRNARHRHLTKKALLLEEKDPESRRDLFSAYAILDRRHVQESLDHLRVPRLPVQFVLESTRPPSHDEVDLLDIKTHQTSDGDYLVDRLSRATTNRRRYFAYWQRHALKLSGFASKPDMQKSVLETMIPVSFTEQVLGPRTGTVAGERPSPDSKPANLPSETEFSMYNRNLDDSLETDTVISHATTARDVDGKSAEFPAPPSIAIGKSEFLCPYCWIVCPSKEGKGRLWQSVYTIVPNVKHVLTSSREHIRHDLQPYICTYEECLDADLLYTSRQAWLEHERLVHRRVWRCFEHPNFISKAKGDLVQHFQDHHRDMEKRQIASYLDIAEVTRADDRQACPFCYSQGPFHKGLQNHIAFHQEQLATFAAPRHLEDTGQASSERAQGARSSSSLDSTISDTFSDLNDLEDNSGELTDHAVAKKLLRAVKNGNFQDALLLLETDEVDVNMTNKSEESLLYIATDNGDKALVNLLIEFGADINARCGRSGNALQAASIRGHTEIMRLLLDIGVDPNAQGGLYGNALQAASYACDKESAQFLLDRGADVNLEGGHYGTALQAASAGGCIEIVKLLLDRGADANLEGGHYSTALQAASAGGFLVIVKLLLDRGADINLEGGGYGTALQAASARGRTEIVELLLGRGADVNLEGGEYGTALQAASARGFLVIVKLLLDRGADVNIQGGKYGSALRAAERFGGQEIVDILLKAGAKHDDEPEPTEIESSDQI